MEGEEFCVSVSLELEVDEEEDEAVCPDAVAQEQTEAARRQAHTRRTAAAVLKFGTKEETRFTI